MPGHSQKLKRGDENELERKLRLEKIVRARLEQMSANQHLRLSTETNDERAARLERLSANQYLRLAAETNYEKAKKKQRKFEIGVLKNKFFQGMSSLAL